MGLPTATTAKLTAPRSPTTLEHAAQVLGDAHPLADAHGSIARSAEATADNTTTGASRDARESRTPTTAAPKDCDFPNNSWYLASMTLETTASTNQSDSYVIFQMSSGNDTYFRRGV